MEAKNCKEAKMSRKVALLKSGQPVKIGEIIATHAMTNEVLIRCDDGTRVMAEGIRKVGSDLQSEIWKVVE